VSTSQRYDIRPSSTGNPCTNTNSQAPTPQSFARAKNFSSPDSKHHSDRHMPTQTAPPDIDATFLTTDTSFVEHPPTTSKPPSRYSSVPSARTPARGSARGGASASTAGRGARGSGIARGGMIGTSRGARGGVARGVGRGRGTTTGMR
jgi:DASH complex subunit DAM1